MWHAAGGTPVLLITYLFATPEVLTFFGGTLFLVIPGMLVTSMPPFILSILFLLPSLAFLHSSPSLVKLVLFSFFFSSVVNHSFKPIAAIAR